MAQITYGSITVSDLTDGKNANIWTTTVAPTTPNYTFNISNLTGSDDEPREGDIILYSVYRYTISSIDATTVLAGNRQSLQGAAGTDGGKWYSGTGITGTSTTATIFNNSGVANAIVGDMYLNTSTNNTYRCTVAGVSSVAKWVYVNNIKGSQGTSVTKTETEYYRKLAGGQAPQPSTTGSTTIPEYVDGCTYYTRTVTYLSAGDPVKGEWLEATTLTNQIKDAYEAWIAAGAVEQKAKSIVQDSNGVTVAAGINGADVTPGTTSTYGYNTIMAPTYLGLRYNAINLAKLSTTESTPELQFYFPSFSGSSNTPVQGDKGLTLGTSGMNFYHTGSNTADATLNSNGLTISNGSIVLGTTSGIAAGNVTLSNKNFERSINGTNHNDLRFAIGSKFGVASDGTLYSSGLDSVVSRVDKTEMKLAGTYALSQTSSGTTAKAATITPALSDTSKWELTTGTIVTVKFTNANTAANPTLNINSKGAKAIKTYAGGNLSADEYKWKAGSTFTFIYNGTNWLMQDSTASVRMNSAESRITQTATSIESVVANNDTYTAPDGTTKTNAIKSAIKQNADNIELKVSKDGVIASINASVEESGGSAVKISADKVNIEGAAIFTGSGRLSETSLDNAYDVKGAASAAESNAKDYADGAVADKADKSNAVARTQRIYYRKTSSGAPSANTTWLATSGTGYGNWSLKVPQMTSGTTKYPYLYTAVQTQTVAQMAAGNACSCSAVLLDDTTTVIDGGTIITGTVNANAVNASSGTFDTANIPNLNASKITAGDISADRMKVNSISAINSNTGTVKIAASKVAIDGTAIFNAIESDVAGVAQDAVDGIEVGGRNLLRRSDYAVYNTSDYNNNGNGATFSEDRITVPFGKEVFQYPYASQRISTVIPSGTKITCSVYVYKQTIADGNHRVYVSPLRSNNTVYWSNIHNIDVNSTGRHTWTFTTTEDAYGFVADFDSRNSTSGEMILGRIKVEIGDKATDWTPAPEDARSEIDAKKSVHTLLPSGGQSSSQSTYANILGWAEEGHVDTWSVTSTEDVKVGDTIRVGYWVSDMGTSGNRPIVYVVGTVTQILNNTQLKMTSHGLDTTIIDGGNILTNSIGADKIKVNEIEIGAAQITSGTIATARIPNLDAGKITTGTINIGRIPNDALNSNIEVGGRNLLLNSSNMPFVSSGIGGYRASGGTASHITITDPPISGISGGIRITNSGTSAARIGLAQDHRYNTFIVGEKYSQSFWIRASTSFTSTVYAQMIWRAPDQTTGPVSKSMTLTTSWQYVKGEGATLQGTQADYYSAGYVYASNVPAGAYIEVCADKVEKGNKSTDWSPAPEDVQAEIDAKKSVHTLMTGNAYGNTYANILGFVAEGKSQQWTVNTSATPLTNVKVGDTCRIAYKVSDMNGAYVYPTGVVTGVGNNTVDMIMHGIDTTVIDGGNILTNSIGANQIAANAITADELAANAVTANKIATNAVTSDKIATGAITVGKINPVVYTYSNNGKGNGYAKLCTISVTENYRNKPIQFTLHSRNKNATDVSWRFLNSNSPSTCIVSSATYDGDTPLYYVGTGGTYTIYFALGESYDEVRIYDLIIPYTTGLTVTWDGAYYGTSLPSGAVEFIKLAGTRTSAELDNAAKTATTYITHIDNNGIRIHPSSTENNSVVINATGMEVFKGGTTSAYSVAKYGDSARIGKEDGSHLTLAPDSMSMSDGTKDVFNLLQKTMYIYWNRNYKGRQFANSTDRYVDSWDTNTTISTWDSIAVNYKLNNTSKTKKITSISNGVLVNDEIYVHFNYNGTIITLTYGRGSSAASSDIIKLESAVVYYVTDKKLSQLHTGTYPNTTVSGALRIGNGTSDSNRINLMLVDWSGTGKFKGDILAFCGADSSGGMSLTKAEENIDAFKYEDANGHVYIDAYRVGRIVSLLCVVSKTTSIAPGANLYQLNLTNAHLPKPLGTNTSGTGISGKNMIIGNIYYNRTVTPNRYEFVCRNGGSTAVSTGGVGFTITYICQIDEVSGEIKYMDD